MKTLPFFVTLFLTCDFVCLQNFEIEPGSGFESYLFKVLSLAGTGKEDEGIENYMTVPDLIKRNGYPVETHYVMTDDGYILEVHRIPGSADCDNAVLGSRDPILLQHGVFMDSSNWILTGPDKAFGYYLADNCHDVWMGNNRGNRYSRNHTSLSPTANPALFWNFSYHEMGVYDLPATVDYILSKTNKKSLFFAGVSLSTTTFFVFLSERPEYNEKIRLALAYGPVAYFENALGPFPLLSMLTPFSGALTMFSQVTGIYELLPWPLNLSSKVAALTVCGRYSLTRELCGLLCLLVTNFNPENVYQGLSADILRHVPAGGSVKTVVHLAQNIWSRRFAKYDYGGRRNIERYGSSKSPEYKWANIHVPVALFWGSGDWMSTGKDVAKIENRLQNVTSFNIEDPKFGHNDYVWGKGARELLYRPSLTLMKLY